jgi:hypothetical protein
VLPGAAAPAPVKLLISANTEAPPPKDCESVMSVLLDVLPDEPASKPV